MTELFGDASRNGDWTAVRLRVRGESIVDADAEGLSQDLAGLTLLEAASVEGEELAVEALAAAIGPAFRAAPHETRLAVAMSGGVDSAVALLRAGRDAIGVTLRLWVDPEAPHTERACCSPDAVRAARRTCHSLGLPHVTLDLRKEFRRAVVDQFVRAYERGDTPNPCTRCNGAFRFDELLAFTRRAGASRLVTGHYVRLARHRGRLLLARAADPDKDQSYMLAGLDPAVLERLWFPLGEQTKTQTRAEAARAGLAAAGRPESQEACFLGGDDYRSFLQRRGLSSADGPIIDTDGRELGRHGGHWRFTPGQRRGLGVAAREPLYALKTVPRTNTVVVAPRNALVTNTVVARGRVHVSVAQAEAKLRYRSPAVPTHVTTTPRGFRLDLEQPAYAVAKGQTAVLYEDGVVVGAGVITSTTT
jgi:tRNA-uridine 2-sulfurtransferase